MAQTKKLSWSFPLKELFFMRIEILVVAFVGVLMFLLIFAQSNQSWISALLLTLIFLVLYFILSFAIQKIRKAEEQYHLTSTHLEIIKKSRNRTKKAKVHLSKVHRHKLDKTFLGGYLLTKDRKKHLLFFNTRKELNKFDSTLKKHLKRKKK